MGESLWPVLHSVNISGFTVSLELMLPLTSYNPEKSFKH